MTDLTTIKKETIVDAMQQTVSVIRSTKKKESDPVGTKCAWVVDFSTYNQAEILELAARSLVIDAQRLWREGHIEAEGTLGKDDFTRDRKARGPSKKAATDFLKAMSAEERQAWLKEAGLI